MTHDTTAEQKVVDSLLGELGLSLPQLYAAVGLDAALIGVTDAERRVALDHPDVWMRFARFARAHARESERRAAALQLTADAFQYTAIQSLTQAAPIRWIADALRSPDPTLN
jgi:hypothetical protein